MRSCIVLVNDARLPLCPMFLSSFRERVLRFLISAAPFLVQRISK